MAKSGEDCASASGFTLTELIVVVSIILIVGGLSIPSLSRTIDNSRLKSATQMLAATYQDARIRATQENTSYELLVSPLGIKPAQICIDLDGDGTCGPGEPVTIFASQITLTNGVPVPLSAAQLNYQVFNTESSAMYTQQGVLAPGLAWNSRGLPCQRLISAASPCSITGWVQHVQLQGSGGNILYGAVSVSPTGRVKTWIFIPSGNGNGQWF
jgi:prepilin-type N-terminal cleavage/methylation domain-containing protein